MRSVARRPQTGALLAETRVNEEMNRRVLAIYAGERFQSDTRLSCVACVSGIMPQHDHALQMVL